MRRNVKSGHHYRLLAMVRVGYIPPMPSSSTKLLTWPEGTTTALAEWIDRAAALGVDLPVVRIGGEWRVSESAAVREALRHAAACECAALRRHLDDASRGIAEEAEKPTLRSMRLAAGLTQLQAARLLGITRGALSTSEARAVATPAALQRARAAYAKQGGTR